MFGELLALLTTFVFILSNALFRKTEKYVSPPQINTIRTAIGTITFYGLAILLGVLPQMFLLPEYIWFILILSFIFGQFFGDTAYFFSQKRMGTTLAMGISMTFPFFTFSLSILFLNQSVPTSYFISAIIIGLGIICIAFGQYKKKHPQQDLLTAFDEKIHITDTSDLKDLGLSISLGLIAALSWAIGAVLTEFGINEVSKTLGNASYSSLIGNLIRFPFTLVMLTGLSWWYSESQSVKTWSKTTWYWLIGASILGTSIGAFLYTEAARIAGASLLSLIVTTSPLFAVPISWLVNQEKITRWGVLGVSLSVVGVMIVLIFP